MSSPSLKSLNVHKPIDKHLNRLPHWEQAGVMQFVTWSLGDALPAVKRRQLISEREDWLRSHPKPWSPETEAEFHQLFSERVQEWLDAGSGSCLLRDSRAAELIAGILRMEDGGRFHLNSFVIMPNHVHVLFAPEADESLPRILKDWKGRSARQINLVLGREGPVWMKDYWDRLIRSREHFHYVRRYIAQNPAKANLLTGSFVYWTR
jgi:REP element-mobilizing transposase RayT